MPHRATDPSLRPARLRRTPLARLPQIDRLLRWLRTPRQQTVLNRTFSGLFATAAVVLSFVRRGAAA